MFLKVRIPLLAGLVAGFVLPAGAQMIYSKQNLFDESTGYVQSNVNGAWFRGSGVIARDSKLIYSCGHVFYENGEWATEYRFHRAYHSSESPYTDTGASPRGFRYFTSYGSNASYYGDESSRTYAYDFTVFYGNDSFGSAVGWWKDGGAVLRSNRWKTIVGYPSMVDYTGAPGYAYQHATDWFTNKGVQEFGSYHRIDGVSTGRGNSGGPVFVFDSDTDDYYLGGILVSGSPSLAGVYALNEDSNTMASNALGLEQVTRTFSNTSAKNIADGRKVFTKRRAKVSGFSDSVNNINFSTHIQAARRGDVDVLLRSPTGRIRWVAKRSSATGRNLTVENADYTSSFRGVAANGNWSLKMRDVRFGKRTKFRDFTISIKALGEE